MFQISEVLKRVPFFRTLGKEGIEFIVEKLKFKPFEENAVICKTGDPGDKMYIIINGNVKVVVYPEDGGEENVIAHLSSGDYFGEMSLLTGEPRSASVITTEPSEMFILNKADFDVIVERYPSISLSMGKIMSQRLRDTLQKAAQHGGSASSPSVKGSLTDRNLIDVLKFCETNSLNGKVSVKKGDLSGEIFYEKGELQKVTMGDLKDDEAMDLMLNWTEGEFIIEPRAIQLEGTTPIAESAGTVNSRRIIIINNSIVVQKVLQRAFENSGYEVYAVESCTKAKNLVDSLNPALVVSDTKLPDCSASDFAHTLRNSSNIPILFLTDASNRGQFQEELRGISDIYFTDSPEADVTMDAAKKLLSK